MALGPDTALRLRKAEEQVDAQILAATPGEAILHPLGDLPTPERQILLNRYGAVGWNASIAHAHQMDGGRDSLRLMPPSARR